MAPQAPIRDDVTVIIPTLGRPMLQGCLESLASGSLLPGRLVLVDQGTNLDTDAWARTLGSTGVAIDHIRSTARGTAAAMNVALAAVSTRLVTVTHDDCRVAADWLERICGELDVGGNCIVTGQVRPEGDTPVPGAITASERALHTRPLLDRDPLFPDNMGFPLSVADRIGAFDEDERLRYAEDNDWSFRALRSAISIVYVPNVVVTHLAWRDQDQRAATYRNYARSQGGFYGKHLRGRDWYIALRILYDLARGPWMWIKGASTLQPDLTAYGRAYMRDLPAGLIAGLRRST